MANMLKNNIAAIAQGKLDELNKAGQAGIDGISLYMFYYYLSNLRDRRRIKANSSYCMEHFKWGKERFYNAKKLLEEVGLVENAQIRENGSFSTVYVNLPYKIGNDKAAVLLEGLRRCPSTRESPYKDTNNPSVTSNYPSVKEEERENFSNLNNVTKVTSVTSPSLTVLTGIKTPRARVRTLPETDEYVNKIVKGWKKFTGKGEVVSKETAKNIINMRDKYGEEEIIRAITNTSHYTGDYKARRKLSGIFKNEKTFLGTLNFTWEEKAESETINHSEGSTLIRSSYE